MQDCLFCKMSAKQIDTQPVYQDDDVFVIHDIAPKAKTHLLVIPHKHIVSLNELTEADHQLMGKIMLLLPKIAEKQGLPGFRTIINTGKAGGQEIFHLHFHLLGGNKLLFV